MHAPFLNLRRVCAMRLALAILVAVSIVTALVAAPEVLVQRDAFAQQGNVPPPDPACAPFGTTTPAGVQQPTPLDEPSRPIWCYPISQSVETYIEGSNDWVDTYDNDGPALQRIDPDYNVYAADG